MPAAPFVECKIYYGVYTSFSADQRRYYLYWRQEFDAGRIIQATDTMLFVAAYEAAVFRNNLQSVMDRWIKLWRAYPEARAFRSFCSGWVDDVRAIAGFKVYDDLSRDLYAGRARFDAAVRAEVPPELDDVLALLAEGMQYGAIPVERVLRAMTALRGTPHGDSILAAALAAAPTRETRQVLSSYFTADHLAPYLPKDRVVSTWYLSAGVRRAARDLFEEAKARSPLATLLARQ